MLIIGVGCGAIALKVTLEMNVIFTNADLATKLGHIFTNADLATKHGRSRVAKKAPQRRPNMKIVPTERAPALGLTTQGQAEPFSSKYRSAEPPG